MMSEAEIQAEIVGQHLRSRIPHAAFGMFFNGYRLKSEPKRILAWLLKKNLKGEMLMGQLYERMAGIPLPSRDRVSELNAAWSAQQSR